MEGRSSVNYLMESAICAWDIGNTSFPFLTSFCTYSGCIYSESMLILSWEDQFAALSVIVLM